MLGTTTYMQYRRPEARYTCKHCKKLFVNESRFLEHQCKQMKRLEEFKSPIGQAAFHYYQLWLRNMKRLPPPAESFLTSKYFRTFVNFAEFVKRVQLPRPEKFIWLMVTKDYPPTIWTNDEVYTIYIEFLDRKTSPIEQAMLSIETLQKYADQANINDSDVFKVMTVQEAIKLVHLRKLSPWLLFFSATFMDLCSNRATAEQKIILENLMRPEYWPEKRKQHPEAVTKIKQLVAAIGI